MRTSLAIFTTALVGAIAPTAALADDPTSTIKADLAQLTSDVKSAHDTLIADLAPVVTAAKAGDKAAAKTAMEKFRSDRRAAHEKLHADRQQLRTDLKAAHDAHITGLREIVKPVVEANRASMEEVHTAADAARDALRTAFGPGRGRHGGPTGPTGPSGPTGPTV